MMKHSQHSQHSPPTATYRVTNNAAIHRNIVKEANLLTAEHVVGVRSEKTVSTVSTSPIKAEPWHCWTWKTRRELPFGVVRVATRDDSWIVDRLDGKRRTFTQFHDPGYERTAATAMEIGLAGEKSAVVDGRDSDLAAIVTLTRSIQREKEVAERSIRRHQRAHWS
jgi:hypothetical protein